MSAFCLRLENAQRLHGYILKALLRPARQEAHARPALSVGRQAVRSGVELFAIALHNRKAPIDPSMPGYGKLKSLVSALLEEAEVSSSVEILSDTGGEAKREVAVDWLLEVKSASLAGSFERRRREVKCTIERRKGRWMIVSLAPIEFFSPPSVAS